MVLHLAQTEEGVVLSARASNGPTGAAARPERARLPLGATGGSKTVEESVAEAVDAEREACSRPSALLERWKSARREALLALAAADPGRELVWAASPLKPSTLATTRLAEHWAHALDITEPFGIPLPDTARLRHVAWLAYRSLPYAFEVAGHEPVAVFCDLEGPDGERWTFGQEDAPNVITGSAGSFCRVGARRLAPEHADLVAAGPSGSVVLHLLRNYAR